jgi:hypothetical protein
MPNAYAETPQNLSWICAQEGQIFLLKQARHKYYYQKLSKMIKAQMV